MLASLSVRTMLSPGACGLRVVVQPTVSGGQQGSRSPDIKFQRLGSSMTGAEEERRRITNRVGDRLRQGAELLYLK